MTFWASNVNENLNVDFTANNVWSLLIIVSILLVGMLLANILKNVIPFLRKSLIPQSVLGGILVLLFATIYQAISGNVFFDLNVFSTMDSYGTQALSGSQILQIITYHCLGIGFVAMSLKTNEGDKKKTNGRDVFNTGVTTVSGYLLQAILGLALTIGFCAITTSTLIPEAGALLPLGYGQGTGQALSWGSIIEEKNPSFHGANFGLTIAALGFLSASLGGVIYLNILKAQHKINPDLHENENLTVENFQKQNEISNTGSIDKFTIELGLVVAVYAISYLAMHLLGKLVGESLKTTIFGFNFLLGTIFAILVRTILNALLKKGVIKKQYINNFMLNRISGCAFDIMIVAGIAVIRLDLLLEYWYVLIIMGLIGAAATFFYVRFVCKKLFPEYKREEFFAMYGMLTGTASTGMILLREIDPNFETPAAPNLVYQNLPAIIFGLPLIMWIVPNIVNNKVIYPMLIVCIVFFLVMQIILFRNQIFKRKKENSEN